jgi:ankyrin repeat protein
LKAAEELARLLLASGALPGTANCAGFTPLHRAAQFGDVDLVEALLAAGAKASVVTKAFESPLALAERRGDAAVAAALRRVTPPELAAVAPRRCALHHGEHDPNGELPLGQLVH